MRSSSLRSSSSSSGSSHTNAGLVVGIAAVTGRSPDTIEVLDFMSQPDLSKLRIERGGEAAPAARRRRRALRWAGFLILLIAAGAAAYSFRPAVHVELGTAAQTYPSQAYALLNATGYVV